MRIRPYRGKKKGNPFAIESSFTRSIVKWAAAAEAPGAAFVRLLYEVV